MDVNKEKKILRNRIKQLRSQISEKEKKEKSEMIWKKTEVLPVFQYSSIVLLYWSMKDEVQTHDFIKKWCKDKTILLPVIVNNELELRKYPGENEMQKSVKYNISEPTGKAFTMLSDIDLIITPGVAFDKQNNRLGHGKGYYDKLLSGLNAYKIGICYDFQLFDNIPHDEKDVKMDTVISN